MIRILAVSFLFIGVTIAGEKKEARVINEIVEHYELINNAAHTIGISPRLAASVVFTERFLNYNWEDALLDGLFAQSGYNSSVGFAQIKVTTAFWIEKEAHDTQSLYYLGSETARRIPRSTSRSELIHRLLNDSINILYCCAYIAMIEQRWENAPTGFSTGAFLSDQNKTGIIATLYSLGVIQSDGNERMPHPNPQMNHFGETAQRFYDGFVLRAEFP
ncbi:MAG: hypothetical protein KGJ59_04950 [Bacteroidota bacterium]|nr:hypothetical protein [Bacteroidota bacterium]